MQTQPTTNGLTLRRQTVRHLTQNEMGAIEGGDMPATPVSSWWCVKAIVIGGAAIYTLLDDD